MSAKSPSFRFVTLAKKAGRVIISLTTKTIERGDYVLAWYIESLRVMYKNEGVPMSLSEETEAILHQYKDQADSVLSVLTPGQRILFNGLWCRLVSPANGDLDDNYEMLMIIQGIFRTHDFKGDAKHKLSYTVRHTGDRRGRILTFKQDLKAVFGREAYAGTVSALRESYKRSEGKKIYAHGIEDDGKPVPALSNNLNICWLHLLWGFHDEIQSHDEDWIKAHFRYIVAVAQYFEQVAEKAMQDEQNFTGEGWDQSDI